VKFFVPIKFCLFVLLHFFCSEHSLANFPARGFAVILDEGRAEAKLDSFKKNIFQQNQLIDHHQSYVYQFEFINFLQSGSNQVFHGILSGPSPHSSIVRLDLLSDLKSINPLKSFLLIRDVNGSVAWQWNQNLHAAQLLTEKETLQPFINGVNHTPFDFMMPFINWSSQYEKSGRVCGRHAHLFSFIFPNDNGYSRGLKSVRVAIDDGYDVPLRMEYMDGGILPERTFSLQSFKKIGEQWVIKSIDVKDRDAKSTTRFELKGVAQHLDLSQGFFSPKGLGTFTNFSSINFQLL